MVGSPEQLHALLPPITEPPSSATYLVATRKERERPSFSCINHAMLIIVASEASWFYDDGATLQSTRIHLLVISDLGRRLDRMNSC